jgi:hypothetical protein
MCCGVKRTRAICPRSSLVNRYPGTEAYARPSSPDQAVGAHQFRAELGQRNVGVRRLITALRRLGRTSVAGPGRGHSTRHGLACVSAKAYHCGRVGCLLGVALTTCLLKVRDAANTGAGGFEPPYDGIKRRRRICIRSNINELTRRPLQLLPYHALRCCTQSRKSHANRSWQCRKGAVAGCEVSNERNISLRRWNHRSKRFFTSTTCLV